MTAKRTFDVVAAAAGLLVASPVLAAAAVAVKLDDPSGTVFFRQVRVGLGGREFQILKFRSMRASRGGPQVTSASDDRITRVGKLLRRTKLDELPQLVNVLVGDMSLVGPRPEVPRYVAEWPAASRTVILSVRPGLTDPGSIEFRHEESQLAAADDAERHYIDVILPRKVALYEDYVRNRTFLGDLAIIVRTGAAVAR